MSNKIKKILSIIVDILIIIVIFFAVCVSYMSFTSRQNDNVPTLFGKTAFSIQTDSMDPVIKAGDFILGDKYVDQELKKGDIISFKTFNNDGKIFINTHRIVEIEESGAIITRGDNTPDVDPNKIVKGDIVSIYTGFRIGGLGFVLTWLGTQVGFFVAIVLPVLLFTIWEVYKLIRVIMHNQKVKLAEEMEKNNAPSEEEKEAIIQEYLKKQQEEASKKEEK